MINRYSRQSLVIAGAVTLSMLLFVAGCETEPAVDETVVTETTTVVTPDTGGDALNAPPTTTDADALQATAGDILRSPTIYDGRVVTVTGDVDEVMSQRAFTIDSMLSTGDLLVLGTEPVPQVNDADGMRELIASDSVIVTGRVMNFIIPEIETEVGWDLDREIETEFENQPVLIIERISATPEGQAGAATTGTVQ